jgi:hypothetical protein
MDKKQEGVEMLYGGPAKSPEDIIRLQRTGFDFGEVIISNPGSRRL